MSAGTTPQDRDRLRPHHAALVASLLAGRRVIVATDVLVASARLAAQVRELGAAEVLVVGGSRGTGPIDPEVERDALVLGLSGGSIMEALRTFEDALATPPSTLVEAVESFDPAGEALVVAPMFSWAEHLLGRPVFGARPEPWRLLEDKTTVDALWDRSGVARAPSAIVPARPEDLLAAGRELDRGAGTAWVADNRRGWHGGGDLMHWVRTDEDAEVAARQLADEAHVVRVMPFLEGLPCSIHGWVVDDEVVTFRPCEMVMLRVAGRPQLRYAGAATAWHPPPADLLEMRDVAAKAGRRLRDEVGYRGVFTVDGVLTAEGFRPTELNPRFGAALMVLARGCDLPLYLVHCATIERPDLDWRPVDLEREVLTAAAEHPVAAASTIVATRVTDEREVALRREGDRFVVAGDGEDADGTLTLGPTPAGGLVRMVLDRFEVGRPVASDAARAFALSREVFGVDLPELEPAADLGRWRAV